MRIMDAVLAFPVLLLAIFLVAVLGPSLRNAMLAVVIVYLPSFARVTRANVLSVKEQEFIIAARAIGASDWRVMIQHILLNIMSPIIVQVSLGVGMAILIEASLSFLGLGIQPPTPAWGSMLNNGRQFMTIAWWMTPFPGLAIFFTVLAFNFVGDGLREAFDPRQRRR
jgi:peptide/nickel transport system permease protein